MIGVGVEGCELGASDRGEPVADGGREGGEHQRELVVRVAVVRADLVLVDLLRTGRGSGAPAGHHRADAGGGGAPAGHHLTSRRMAVAAALRARGAVPSDNCRW